MWYELALLAVKGEKTLTIYCYEFINQIFIKFKNWICIKLYKRPVFLKKKIITKISYCQKNPIYIHVYTTCISRINALRKVKSAYM